MLHAYVYIETFSSACFNPPANTVIANEKKKLAHTHTAHTRRFDIEARHFEWQSNRTENVKDTMIAVLFTI